MVLFADDTSTIVTGMNRLDFGTNLNQILKDTHSCFIGTLFTLNFNKSQYVEFHFMNNYITTSKIVCDQINLPNVTEIFLGPIIDDTFTWKQHTAHVINKISRSCCALRNIKHFVTLDTLKLISFAHIHYVLSCGIIFWGGSSYAGNAFILQNSAITIMRNLGSRDSCRHLFHKPEVMTFYYQFIYSIILFKLVITIFSILLIRSTSTKPESLLISTYLL
jgi:hypothetical protein